MTQPDTAGTPSMRVTTGIGGLDSILRGGLFAGGIYIVVGAPGAGKTILANQAAYHRVKTGGRVLYVTLLSETHARMLAQLGTLSFFDKSAVGTSVKYVNGFAAVEGDGLDGLLKLIRTEVRGYSANLLVLDGMVAAGLLATSSLSYKKFINELQTWVGLVGCTVLFLTSATPGTDTMPEHTMVDGIFELHTKRRDLRSHRSLTVTKFRGGGFTEGSHQYRITDDGIAVYPRFEAHYQPLQDIRQDRAPAKVGIKALDEIIGGGLPRGSTTLVLGPSGSGKTLLGLHFLSEGARNGEPGLHFGFFEKPGDLMDKAARLSLPFVAGVDEGMIHLRWHVPAEAVLDRLGQELVEEVSARGIRRVFIDGLVGFKEVFYPDRLSGFFSVLSQQLSCLGATVLITEETRELFVQEVEVPTAGVSAIFQNILFLRLVQSQSELQRALMVMKTRDRGHDPAIYRFETTDGGIEIIGRFAEPAPVAIGQKMGKSKRVMGRRRGKR